MLTQGEHFLLFLPDSPTLPITIALCLHLGGACSLTGSFKDLLHLDKFLVEMEGGVGGGGWHPHLHHLIKWLWEQVWDFLALGGPISSVSRRVVKLTVPHYYSAPLPLQKRGYGGMKS